MNLLRCLQTALSNLASNKLRSSLTILGVIIGVGAVIVMVSVVEGARAMIVREFQRLGSDLILIGYQPDRDEMRNTTHRLDGMTMDDVRAIAAQCDLIGQISPEMPGGDQVVHYLDQETDARVTGVGPEYREIRNAPVERGRFITDA